MTKNELIAVLDRQTELMAATELQIHDAIGQMCNLMVELMTEQRKLIAAMPDSAWPGTEENL